MARSSPSLRLPTLTLAIVLGVAPAVPGGALAQTLCSEPVEPVCATAVPATEPSAATDQGVARSRCSEDAETYRDKLVEFRQCLEGSLAAASARVDAADAFIKCLADGEPDCRLRGAR